MNDPTRFGSILRQGPLFRAGLGSVVIKFSSKIMALITVVVLANVLGASDFGVFVFIIALTGLLSMPAQLGLSNLVMKVTSAELVSHEWSVIKGVWRWSSYVSLASSSIIVVTAVVISVGISDSVQETLIYGFLLSLPLVLLVPLSNIRGGALRGLHRVNLGQLPEQILRPGLFLAFVALSMVVGAELSVEMAIAMSVTAAALAFIIGQFLLSKYTPIAVKSAKADYSGWKYWLYAAIPLSLTEGASLIMANTDSVMLGIFTTSSEVGVYKIAVQGAVLIAFVMDALSMVAAPYFSRLHAADKRYELQRLASYTSLASFVFALCAFLFLLIFGRPLLDLLFGSEFSFAYIPLLILAVSHVVSSWVGPVGVLLNMTGNHRVVLAAVASASVLNVALNFVLIPMFSLEGAAWATGVSLVYWKLFLWVASKRRLFINSSPVPLFRAYFS